jgi:hypothetical protein
MRWLSVDPGAAGCGVAWWEGANLARALFVPSPDGVVGPARWVALALAIVDSEAQIAACIVETMRVYTGGRARPADLLDLQGIAGATCAAAATRGAKAVGALAAEWKKQVPRDILGARIAADVERRGWCDRIVAPRRATHRNDVHHAIGLGLWGLERRLVGD